ncbi:MAG: Hpt domain-containing protein [Deltaproteobacteria bacterium]|nr:Hpt domain-containing protein [Deltaproteobacteria bacterium]
MIVGCFLSDFPRQIGFIRNCLPFGNWSEAAMLAHASRGAAGCVEAGKIATILLDLENALNGRRPEESEKMLLQLDEEFLRYREAAEISGMAEESRENPNEDTDS